MQTAAAAHTPAHTSVDTLFMMGHAFCQGGGVGMQIDERVFSGQAVALMAVQCKTPAC